MIVALPRSGGTPAAEKKQKHPGKPKQQPGKGGQPGPTAAQVWGAALYGMGSGGATTLPTLPPTKKGQSVGQAYQKAGAGTAKAVQSGANTVKAAANAVASFNPSQMLGSFMQSAGVVLLVVAFFAVIGAVVGVFRR